MSANPATPTPPSEPKPSAAAAAKPAAQSTATETATKTRTATAVGLIAVAALGFAAALAFIALPKRVAKICVGGPYQGRVCLSDLQCRGGKCADPFATTRPASTVGTQPTTRTTTRPVGRPSLTVAAAPVDNETKAGIVLASSNRIVLAKFRLTTQNSAWMIKKLRFKVSDPAAIEELTLWNGLNQISSLGVGNLSYQGELPIFTTGVNGSIDMVVRAKLRPIGSGAKSGANVKLTLVGDEGEFLAVAVNDQNVRLTGLPQSVAGENKIVRKTKPTLSVLPVPANEVLRTGSNVPLIRFAVAADSIGPVAFKKLTFKVNKQQAGAIFKVGGLSDSGVSEIGSRKPLAGAALVKGDSISTDQCVRTVGSVGTCLVVVAFNNEQVIPAGTTKQYELKAVIGGALQSAGAFVTSLDAAPDTKITSGYLSLNGGRVPEWTIDEQNNALTDGVLHRFIWSDMSAAPHRQTNVDAGTGPFTGSADWTNGHMLMALPLEYRLAAP